jgi:two-component system, OmpR family, phosphate regulon response regulator PhoB
MRLWHHAKSPRSCDLEQAERDLMEHAKESPTASPAASANLRVLVCDDDQGTRFVLKRVLVREHHAEVTEAADGMQALTLLKSQPCDLLILDLRMPGIDGVETLQAVRAIPGLERLPVVVLSGERSAESVQQVIQLGVVDFLLKPLHRDTTSERLHAIVHRIDLAVHEKAEADAPPAAKPKTETA